MIIIVGKKAFIKNTKELIRKKDFVIIDATDDSEASLSNKISPVSVKDEIAPPQKIVEALSDPDVYEYEIDKKKLKAMWKKWGRRKKTMEAFYAIFRIMLEEDLNIFIVLDTKAYKYMKDKYCELVNNMLDSRIKFVYTYHEYLEDRDCLVRSLSKSDVKTLQAVVKEIEQDLEERSDDISTDIRKKKKRHDAEKEQKTKNYSKFFKDILKDDNLDIW